MNYHTCGGKGHIKRECPNKIVMLINEKTVRKVMMLIQIQMMMMICSMVVLHHFLPLFVFLRC
jgi:hypothetical protein